MVRQREREKERERERVSQRYINCDIKSVRQRERQTQEVMR